jgi:hypothetical protein
MACYIKDQSYTVALAKVNDADSTQQIDKLEAKNKNLKNSLKEHLIKDQSIFEDKSAKCNDDEAHHLKHRIRI